MQLIEHSWLFETEAVIRRGASLFFTLPPCLGLSRLWIESTMPWPKLQPIADEMRAPGRTLIRESRVQNETRTLHSELAFRQQSLVRFFDHVLSLFSAEEAAIVMLLKKDRGKRLSCPFLSTLSLTSPPFLQRQKENDNIGHSCNRGNT